MPVLGNYIWKSDSHTHANIAYFIHNSKQKIQISCFTGKILEKEGDLDPKIVNLPTNFPNFKKMNSNILAKKDLKKLIE